MAEKWRASFNASGSIISVDYRGLRYNSDNGERADDIYLYTAAEHEEVEKLRLGHERYEKLRVLNVQQFQELFRRNIETGVSFDALVDALPKIGDQ